MSEERWKTTEEIKSEILHLKANRGGKKAEHVSNIDIPEALYLQLQISNSIGELLFQFFLFFRFRRGLGRRRRRFSAAGSLGALGGARLGTRLLTRVLRQNVFERILNGFFDGIVLRESYRAG